MTMYLDSFEEGFNQNILKRAEGYYREGKVQSLHRIDELLTTSGHVEE